jgi:hypothetical protein
MSKEVVRETRVSKGPSKGLNVAGRVNKAIATNIGGEGAEQSTSSKQTVRIVQDGDVTTEDSVTTVEKG